MGNYCYSKDVPVYFYEKIPLYTVRNDRNDRNGGKNIKDSCVVLKYYHRPLFYVDKNNLEKVWENSDRGEGLTFVSMHGKKIFRDRKNGRFFVVEK